MPTGSNRVLHVSDGGTGNATGALDGLTVGGTPVDHLIGADFAKGEGYLRAPDDRSAQFGWLDQPNSVNRWMALGGPLGAPATLVALGANTDVNANFATQGAGNFNWGNGSGQLLSLLDPGGYVFSYPTIGASASFGGAVKYSAVGVVGTDIPVALVPAGQAGASIGQNNSTPHEGTYAAGRSCIATGYGSGALGTACVSGGYYSLTIGNYANDQNIAGKICFSGGRPGTVTGATQGSFQTMYCNTVDNTSVIATVSGAAVSQFNMAGIINNASQAINITVVARDTANTGICAAWFIKALINRDGSAGATTIVGKTGDGAPTFSTGASASTWLVALSADTTNGAAKITCTGATGHSVRFGIVTGPNSEIING